VKPQVVVTPLQSVPEHGGLPADPTATGLHVPRLFGRLHAPQFCVPDSHESLQQ
jgi:hypothetical protein